MLNLLSAEQLRLKKSKPFWFGTALMFLLGIYGVCSKYLDMIRCGQPEYFDDAIFLYAVLAGCCCAVFSSTFIGTEYSDGTIRNKLIIGHKRGSIYGANLILCILAAIFMAAAYLLPYSILGLFLLEPPQIPVGAILLYMGISILTLAAYASLYCMISMLVTRKSTSAILCILIFFGLLITALVINEMLNAPEFISGYSLTVNGIEQGSPEPNPKYLKPMARKIYQFFYDLLPSGQGLQLSARNVIHPLLMALLAIFTGITTTVCGLMAFRKKDLR